MRNARRMGLWSFVFHGLTLVLFICAGSASAQQRQKVLIKAPAENTKYTQRLTIDAGHAAGHTIGLFEIHRTYPGDAPLINGVKLKESWARGYSDYLDRNGLSTNYITYVFENGDKVFATATSLGQADASGRRATTSVGRIHGGTGKFAGIKGLTRSTGASQGQAGFNESNAEMEYWFEK